MTDKNLIKSAFEARNIKLVKVLFDNSDLDYLFKKDYSWSCSLSEIGVFNNSLGFNFTIDYLYKKRRFDIVKKFFSNSSNLSNASAFLDSKNFKRLRKITHKNWWILKDDHCLKEAIKYDNLFMVKTLIKLYKSYNCDLNFVIPNLNYYFESNFNSQFNGRKQDFRVLKLLYKECNKLPSILINSAFNAHNKEIIKEKLEKIIEIFKLKEIDYCESNILEALNDKELFFYLYKKTKKNQKNQFFSLGYYSNMISLLERKLQERYCKIDKDIVAFLLQNNLKVISKSN